MSEEFRIMGFRELEKFYEENGYYADQDPRNAMNFFDTDTPERRMERINKELEERKAIDVKEDTGGLLDALPMSKEEGMKRRKEIKDEDINKAIEKGTMARAAKGGSMSKQMELFDEGGLKDEGGTVDPVSGNEVPPGSTQEEVRDDIPAQLSEGEFVFPADVVRFLGLNFLMELRQKAKAGLKRMEEMGQMGNADEATLPDDIPFTLDDLDTREETEEEKREMAQGGVIQAQAGTYVAPNFTGTFTQPSAVAPQFSAPNVQQPSNLPLTQNLAPAPVGGFRPIQFQQPPQATGETFTYQQLLGSKPGQYDEFREYKNAEGMILNIPFKNGQPLYPVPEGYSYVDPEEVKVEDPKVTQVKPQTAKVVEDSSGDDPEDIKTGAVDLTGAPLSYLSMPFSKNMDALDKELYDIAFTQTKLFDPREIAKSTLFGKVNANDIILSSITPVVESFKNSFIVGSDFKLGKSHITGDNIKLQKGFNLADMLPTDRDRLAQKIANRRNEIELAITDRVNGNILSMKDLNAKFEKFGIERPRLTGITLQDRRNLTKAVNELVVKENQSIKKGLEAIEERPTEATDGGTQTFTQEQFEQSYDPSTDYSSGDSGDSGFGAGQDIGTGVDTSGFTDTSTGLGVGAKGGFFSKSKLKKPKKMKRGGLASR